MALGESGRWFSMIYWYMEIRFGGKIGIDKDEWTFSIWLKDNVYFRQNERVRVSSFNVYFCVITAKQAYFKIAYLFVVNTDYKKYSTIRGFTCGMRARFNVCTSIYQCKLQRYLLYGNCIRKKEKGKRKEEKKKKNRWFLSTSLIFYLQNSANPSQCNQGQAKLSTRFKKQNKKHFLLDRLYVTRSMVILH